LTPKLRKSFAFSAAFLALTAVRDGLDETVRRLKDNGKISRRPRVLVGGPNRLTIHLFSAIVAIITAR
jgi:hypothetical protein